ncbi:hypothetical protein HPP92_007315 [Vanilla planifolia]|uniref:Uncharacterized protein n=1 Tax=Vanilla planifolia TaxID=51239 RepID=A0A835RQY5_VANPL|nr:hypothetical protein HPP92_007315 [Vanilla planifolia]
MEYAKGGEFLPPLPGSVDTLSQPAAFPPARPAVAFCHSHGVFHRDQSRRTSSDDRNNLKISDLAFSAIAADPPSVATASRTRSVARRPTRSDDTAKKGYNGAKIDVSGPGGIILFTV